MKLVRISAQNFGGSASFDLPLTGVNAIVGRNFGGKTRIANAIKVLLLGYLPELGKKNAATFGLASGRAMTVSGEFDNGMRITRTFVVRGDSVKQEADVPPAIEALGTLAFTLNADDYFALSERERVAYVFANLPLAGAPDPRKTVIDAIADRSVERVARVMEVVFGKPGANASLPIQSQIEIALGNATENARAAREYAVRMDKGAQAVETLRLQDAPQIDLGTLKAEKEGIAAGIASLSLARGEVVAAKRAEDLNADRRRRLTQELSRGTVDALQASHDKLTADLREIDGKIAPQGADAADLASAEGEMRDAINAADRTGWEVASLAKAYKASLQELEGVRHAQSCPYCLASGTDWRERKVGEIEAAMKGMQAKIDQLAAHERALRDSATTAEERARSYRAERQARADHELARARTFGDLTACGSKLKRAMDAERELAEIPQPADHGAQLLRIDADLEDRRKRLNAVDDTLRSVDRRANDLRRIAEAEKARDDAKEDLALGVAVLEALRGLQANLVEAAFGPLLDRANRIFGHLLPTPLAYHEGELGSWRDGVWVSHRIFSGTEKALAYASLQAALAAGSPIKVMIVDELGRLDDRNAVRLVDAALLAVQRGDIDTFIGIDAGRMEVYMPAFCPDNGGQVIDIGGAS